MAEVDTEIDTEEKEITNENVENVTIESAKPKELKVKVDILLNATGNIPIMRRRKWAVDQDKQISWIISFVHKYLKLDPEEKLFLYVNQTFAPAPDQIVKNLYECYGTNGTLILYYCKGQTWG